jgi:hypothetical protein
MKEHRGLKLIYFIIFLFRKEIKKMQHYLNEKHQPLMEKRQNYSKRKKN